MISLDIDSAQVDADLAEAPDRTTRAMVRSLNRGIASGRTVMVREVSRDMGIKSSDVREAMTMREATANRLEASLGAKGKRIPLMAFGARGPYPSRGRGRGVSYRLRGGRGSHPHAFLARKRSGEMGVFERKDGAVRHGPQPQRSQLPIRELYGPSIAHVFRKFRPAGLARAEEQFQKNFAHEIAWVMKQAGGAPASAGTD